MLVLHFEYYYLNCLTSYYQYYVHCMLLLIAPPSSCVRSPTWPAITAAALWILLLLRRLFEKQTVAPLSNRWKPRYKPEGGGYVHVWWRCSSCATGPGPSIAHWLILIWTAIEFIKVRVTIQETIEYVGGKSTSPKTKRELWLGPG